jgi:molybdenum cofactor cytidylyltransferase
MTDSSRAVTKELRNTSRKARVSAVVLAAGLSSRMDIGPKLLLSIGGAPMIRHTVLNVLGVSPVEVVVVTGCHAAEVEAALEGLPIRCVFNPDYRNGQPTSVAQGIRSLREPCDAVMVALGDQPLVTPRHLLDLIDAFVSLRDKSILAPHHRGMRGNPVIFSARHIRLAVAGELKLGCRKLIETLPDEVAAMEFDSDVFVADCDTREDFERLTARLASS